MNRTINSKLDSNNFPYIDVEIINPANDKFVRGKAIIDTGAAYCLLKQSLITYLELQHVDGTSYLHPQYGERQASNYRINLSFDLANVDGAAQLQMLRVSVIESEEYPAAMIIGVELLKLCQFNYDGINKTFQLTLTSN